MLFWGLLIIIIAYWAHDHILIIKAPLFTPESQHLRLLEIYGSCCSLLAVLSLKRRESRSRSYGYTGAYPEKPKPKKIYTKQSYHASNIPHFGVTLLQVGNMGSDFERAPSRGL